MHDNPMIVGYFFQERAKIFLNTVLKPLFKVKDFWLRYEWQSRGSPHIHGVLWQEDAPDMNEENFSEETIEIIKTYFDKFCTAFNPSFTIDPMNPCEQKFSDIPAYEKEQDLINLINRVQRHTQHENHCLRLDK